MSTLWQEYRLKELILVRLYKKFDSMPISLNCFEVKQFQNTNMT